MHKNNQQGQEEYSVTNPQKGQKLPTGGVGRNQPTLLAEISQQGQEEYSVTKPQEGQKQPPNSISSSSISSNTVLYKNIIVGGGKNTTPYTLPTWLGKSPYHRLVRLYETMWEYTFNVAAKKIAVSSSDSSTIKRLRVTYGEPFAALIIILHFEWRGANGNDDKIHKALFNKGFPVTWMGNGAPLYMSFIKNHLLVKNEEEASVRIKEVINKITQI